MRGEQLKVLLIDDSPADRDAKRQGRIADLRQEGTDVDLSCPVDQYAIEQIFLNVLENSLDACSDPVQIEVCWGEGEIDGCPSLRAAIRDSGPGLTADQRARLFEPFYTTKTRGTGLGTSIAQRLVLAHGGRMGVCPEPSEGAVIVIELPRYWEALP